MAGTGSFPLDLQGRTKRRPFQNQAVLAAIKSIIPITQTIIDIGSSVGHMVRELRASGYSIYGIDGTEGIGQLSDGLVVQCDLTTLSEDQTTHKSDWGIFFDVGEHIPRQYENQVIKAVCSIPRIGLILSWADHIVPDRKIHNRRTDYYIANAFGLNGWVVDESLSEEIRKASGDYVRMNERLLVLHPVSTEERECNV